MDAPDEEEPHHDSEFAEYDPTGRYCRYKEVLGRGAFKTVYKAFDEFEGIEVAWNQIKVFDVARNHDDLDRLCFEVHLLQTLKHKNIIKFYKSWVDTNNDNINFITEIFTSGTLRQYRKKYKRVELQALKNWSRQILRGLFYLHSHDPPVIHRDLKCDNIFVNGNTGEVKIGDLGLAATLCKANSAHTVIGTPEFMAPELYEEQYNELVDIYAFGMCLLELVTLEYPYMECANPAQIYKKVSAGVKPLSLGQVKDPEVRKFIDKCIANVSERLSARELIMDPFLASNPEDTKILHENIPTDASDYEQHHPVTDITFFGFKDSLPISNGSFSVEGQRKDQNTIFLKLCIVDSTGYIRNIHFPFDIEADTSISVASEMVSELDLTDQNLSTIAAMIDSEIQAHVPSWHPGEDFEDNLSDKQVEPNEYEVEHEETIKTEGETSNHPTLDGLMLEQVSSSPSDTRDSPNDDANVTLVESTHSVSSSATHETNEPDESPEILEAITQKLGQLLLEQQKELLELKNKHELATDDVLKELPPELRSSALHLCQLKYSNHEDSTKSDGHGHGVQCGSQMNEDLINNPLSTSTSEQLDQSKAGEVDNYEIGSDLPP